jgi:hypothetical protein
LLVFGADANDVPRQAEALEDIDELPAEPELAGARTAAARCSAAAAVAVASTTRSAPISP